MPPKPWAEVEDCWQVRGRKEEDEKCRKGGGLQPPNSNKNKLGHWDPWPRETYLNKEGERKRERELEMGLEKQQVSMHHRFLFI